MHFERAACFSLSDAIDQPKFSMYRRSSHRLARRDPPRAMELPHRAHGPPLCSGLSSSGCSSPMMTGVFAPFLPFDLTRQHRYLQGPVSDPTATDPVLCHLSRVTISPLVGPLPENVEDRNRTNALTSLLSTLFPFYKDVHLCLGNPNTLFLVRRLPGAEPAARFQQPGGTVSPVLQVLPAGGQRTSARIAEYARTRPHPLAIASGCGSLLANENRPYGSSGRRQRESPSSFRTMPRARLSSLPQHDDWTKLKAIAGATNHSVLYGADDEVWAFPDRRMMEFYCGLHRTE